jgi:uncharacterized protein YndB with AHSA1/START domain
MEQTNSTAITVEIIVNAPAEKVWKFWTQPDHIMQWNNASDDWHTPRAENDLRPGGKFVFRMEAKDGSFGFDFAGEYNEVVPGQLISYSLGDKRKVKITFLDQGTSTQVTETFDPEQVNPVEMQKAGWQAILNNFKKYAETTR